MTDLSMPLAVQQSENELIDVLCSSLYPGARRESAALVLSYCRAANIDPMLKPVHIVPMRTKTGEKDRYGNDQYEMRDTIMPGVGLYRIQAARTGQYAGQDLPEFGPTRTLAYQRKKIEWVPNLGSDKKVKREDWINEDLEYPEWCAITIYRLVGGHRAAFTAVEYWTENYATAGRDSDAPNEMWARRIRGQLAKCTEAQALRKAFPEVVAMPTADEMEGRTYDIDADPAPEFSAAPTKPRRASEVAQTALPTPSEPDFVVPQRVEQVPVAEPVRVEQVPVQHAAQVEQVPKTQGAPAQQTGEPASQGECMNIIKTCAAKRIDLGAMLSELGLDLDPATLAGMTKDTFKALKARML